MSSQLVTFTLAGASYGLDIRRVQEALGPKARTTVPLAEPGVAGFINLRGQVVLTIDLRTRLGIGVPATDIEPMLVVVQVGGEPLGLLVDDVGDVVDVTGRRLEAPPENLPTSVREKATGAFQLEDSALLVLDFDRLTGAPAIPDPAPAQTRRAL